MTSKTRHLDLSWSNFSDQALQSIKVCKNLRKIDINCTKGERENITSEGILFPLLETVLISVLVLVTHYPVALAIAMVYGASIIK